ncbi:22439_t:CDS:2, partial [Dentiscutata erythropus]
MTPNLITEGEIFNGSSTNGYHELNGVHDGSYSNGHSELNDVPLIAEQGFGTRAIHVGQDPDPYTGAVIPPISLSTTFKQSSIGAHKGYEYSRSSNPTRSAFEQSIASLEKAKYGIAFSSGSAATATIVTTIGTGGHIISVSDVYGGTNRYFSKVASTQGISTTFVDLIDPQNIEPVFRPDTKIVWVETPTNPTLRLIDIQKVAQITHNHGAILVVDNTFMSPYFQNPIELGADIVVHSVTKYINGHSDVVMGVAVMNDETIYEKVKFLQNAIGAVPSPFDSWLANRGLKTLHVRMKQHQENALTIAKFLESSDKVEEVIYPGLESHPQHDLAKKQTRGFGGMLSFRIKGGFEAADTFLRSVESLAEHPARMTHASLTPEHRETVGVTDNLIRLSVGIEEVTDLIADVQQALEIA